METCCETSNKARKSLGFSAFLLVFVRIYRYLISPLLGPHCRFEPTCSHYAEEALRMHGAVRGSFYTLKRLLRCHPWGGSGYDPVPELPPTHKTYGKH